MSPLVASRDEPLPRPTSYEIPCSLGTELIDFIVSALEASRCFVHFCSGPGKVPFVITFDTDRGGGERMGIVVYASRLSLSHGRYVINEGGKRGECYQRLWVDANGLYTTLLVAIDPKAGFFVSAAPSAHDSTRLFLRTTITTECADAILLNSWHAWEHVIDGPIEVLVGGTQRHFLAMIHFERLTAGLDPGHRQLVSDKFQDMFAGLS